LWLLSASIEEELVERERAKVRAEFEKEMARLREEKRAEEVGRAQLQGDLSKLKQQYEEQIARINEQVSDTLYTARRCNFLHFSFTIRT